VDALPYVFYFESFSPDDNLAALRPLYDPFDTGVFATSYGFF